MFTPLLKLRTSAIVLGPPTSLRALQHTSAHLQSRLPAAYYRGGTSRAVIFKQSDLPSDRTQWGPIFLGVIGSPDPNGRQLDGIGGGISSLSKICVVGKAEDGNGENSEKGADVDYTFVAIGVRDGEVDFSSNCGNMSAAIGPYAYDHGFVPPSSSQEVTVRIRNTNTGKLIHSTFPVVNGEGGESEAASVGEFGIDGVAGTGARVRLDFLEPGGSKTGQLLPTGNVVDEFDGVKATCIDAGNPCVFIHASSLDIPGTILPDGIDAHSTLGSRLESIRRQASVAMGISKLASETPGSIPKIAMVSNPSSHVLISGKLVDGGTMDLVVRAMSVRQPHRAVPITVALALAAAANLKGSTVHAVTPTRRVDSEGITLGHPSGKIVVGARFDGRGKLEHATVYRTARRIMEGVVYWK